MRKQWPITRVEFDAGWGYKQNDEGFPPLVDVEYTCMTSEDFKEYSTHLKAEAARRALAMVTGDEI